MRNNLLIRVIRITIGGMNNLQPAKTSPQPTPLAANGVVRAKDLLGTGSVLVIEHADQRYLLRLTKNGKLILTK